MTMLPIEPHLPKIQKLVAEFPVVLLESTPGSGKTTLVPLSLLKTFQGKILILEPRRLAAKMAAERVAALLGEKVGHTVGLIHRFERQIGKSTRLIFLTEGSFLRYLQGSPELPGVDVIVLDEFHERHLTTDLAYGFFRRLKFPQPPRLLIMSATLDESIIKSHYPEVQKISITTPTFPLKIVHAPSDAEWSKRPWDKKVMWGIQEAWDHPGDMLVFLPGMGEIKRVHEILEERLKDQECRLLKLHSQDSSPLSEVMSIEGPRKIILSSNVAESSITIPGVGVVVDLGLQREATYHPWSGMTELITSPHSQAAAIQRGGRAARTGPGVCIRLYTEKDFSAREPYHRPEILKSDLADIVLQLAQWEILPEGFPWPTPPLKKPLEEAQKLLRTIDAIDSEGRLTPIGDKMGRVALPVRLSRIWAEALLKANQETFLEVCRYLSNWAAQGRESQELFGRLKNAQALGTEDRVEKIFMKGFPDRIGKARKDDIITIQGETLRISHHIRREWDPRIEFWLVLDTSGISREVTKLLPLEPEWLASLITQTEETYLDENKGKTVRRFERKLGAITLEVREEVVEGSTHRTLLEKWLREFRESETYVRWELFQDNFFEANPLAEFEWELFIEEILLDDKNLSEESFFQRLEQELQLYFDSSFRIQMKDLYPKKFQLHAGKAVAIHYEKNQPPWIESYIQDFYSRTEHPAVGNGKTPLTLHLWGPHGRAMQVTQNLPGFWDKTYQELKKELSRDYPRHSWPDDPRKAEPLLRKPRPPR